MTENTLTDLPDDHEDDTFGVPSTNGRERAPSQHAPHRTDGTKAPVAAVAPVVVK